MSPRTSRSEASSEGSSEATNTAPNTAPNDASSEAAPSALAGAIADFKPRLRGWLHAYAAAISIASGAVLVAVAAATRGGAAGLSTAIYAATVTLLFGTSASYHRIDWSPRAHSVMKRLDHSMIFVFIAGTYTPLAALLLSRDAAVAVLVAVWTGTVAGVVLQTAWPHAPRWLAVPCYLALGWVAVFVLPQLLHSAGVAALVLIVVGGLLYTVGGIVYGLKKPEPFPGVFGFHEVFHACTVLAALCHYIAVWLAVFS